MQAKAAIVVIRAKSVARRDHPVDLSLLAMLRKHKSSEVDRVMLPATSSIAVINAEHIASRPEVALVTAYCS
jgi:hypothetical protein